MKRKALILILLLAAANSVSAQSVGAAPGEVRLGEIDRGEEETFNIYFTSSGTTEPFEVSLKYQEPFRGSILGGNTYINPEEFSEQEIESWVSFSEETYTIDPSSDTVQNLADGSTVRADGSAEITVRVPEDAEPGYHGGQIQVNPKFPSGSGFGARVLGLARPSFYFRVPGDVERRIEYRGIEAVRTDENQAQIVATFRNTGTVTTALAGGEADISKRDEGNVGTALLNTNLRIPPGETRRMDTRWTSNNVEGGNYEISGTVDYRTGQVFVSDSFTLTDAPREPVEVDQPGQDDSGPEEGSDFPWLLAILLLVLIGLLLYYAGFDFFWTVTILGMIVIIIFILATDTSIIVLLAAMTGAGLLMYYLW